MNVAVIGAGYVGLTSGAVLADQGNRVWVVRRDRKKIDDLKKGIVPIYEPGLSEIVLRNVKAGRLIPTTSYAECVPNADVVFIAVGTPQDEKNGAADLSQVFTAAEEIARNLKEGYTVVVDKSTVPPGTAEAVTDVINKHRKNARVKFDVVSSPEFLREGCAVEDTTHPDRIVIGTESKKARSTMVKLHQAFKSPLVLTGVRSAEIIKYSANAYLSLRIGFIDQIANLCEKMGADIDDIICGIGLDHRIGTHYWFPGLGYGGYCFPKDVNALAALFGKIGEKDNLFTRLDEFNRGRVERLMKKIKNISGNLRGLHIGILGLAAKQKTDDIRCSKAIELALALKKAGAVIKAYDPLALENARFVLGRKITYAPDLYSAAAGNDCLIITIEALEFAKMDLKRIRQSLKKPVIFDIRNALDAKKAVRFGLTVYGTGKP